MAVGTRAKMISQTRKPPNPNCTWLRCAQGQRGAKMQSEIMVSSCWRAKPLSRWINRWVIFRSPNGVKNNWWLRLQRSWDYRFIMVQARFRRTQDWTIDLGRPIHSIYAEDIQKELIFRGDSALFIPIDRDRMDNKSCREILKSLTQKRS